LETSSVLHLQNVSRLNDGTRTRITDTKLTESCQGYQITHYKITNY